MQGRRAFTPGIDKASGYIESQFKKIGCKPLTVRKIIRICDDGVQRKSLEVTIDGKAIDGFDDFVLTNLRFLYGEQSSCCSEY
jgi:hypothetical protein